jgi:hypothetical protein
VLVLDRTSNLVATTSLLGNVRQFDCGVWDVVSDCLHGCSVQRACISFRIIGLTCMRATVWRDRKVWGAELGMLDGKRGDMIGTELMC